MKFKYLSIAIACSIIFICTASAYAAKGGIKAPALEAYGNANNNANFKHGNGNQLKNGNIDLKKLDKELNKEHKLDNKDTQLEKSINKELKKAVKKAIK